MATEQREPGDRRRRGGRWKKILLGLATLALIEAALHPLTGNFGLPAVVHHPPDGRCFGLEPGSAVAYTGMLGKIQRTVTHDVNTLGFRGAPRPRPKPAGVFRLVVVGDSFTYGQGVEADEALPAALERDLRGRGEPAVEVLNFGVPGHNIEEAVEQYGRFASRWEHDVVLWALNDNDLDPPICESTPDPLLGWLVKHVRLCRLGYAAWFLARMGPHGHQDERLVAGVRALDEISRSRGAKLGVVMVGVYPFQGLSPVALAAATSERGVPLHLLRECGRPLPRVPGDGHFSPEGNTNAAACVGEWLQKTTLAPPPRPR